MRPTTQHSGTDWSLCRSKLSLEEGKAGKQYDACRKRLAARDAYKQELMQAVTIEALPGTIEKFEKDGADVALKRMDEEEVLLLS